MASPGIHYVRIKALPLAHTSVTVLELAGHSSIAVTQRYIDVNDEQMANAVELLS